MATILCDVVRRRHRRCRCAHAPVIHAASHFYHEKRVAWVSISMHACDPVPVVMGLRLAALRAAGTPLVNRLLMSKAIYKENCFSIYCNRCSISLKLYLQFCFLPLAVLGNKHILFALA